MMNTIDVIHLYANCRMTMTKGTEESQFIMGKGDLPLVIKAINTGWECKLHLNSEANIGPIDKSVFHREFNSFLNRRFFDKSFTPVEILWMTARHHDVFGLIAAGKAIDNGLCVQPKEDCDANDIFYYLGLYPTVNIVLWDIATDPFVMNCNPGNIAAIKDLSDRGMHILPLLRPVTETGIGNDALRLRFGINKLSDVGPRFSILPGLFIDAMAYNLDLFRLIERDMAISSLSFDIELFTPR